MDKQPRNMWRLRWNPRDQQVAKQHSQRRDVEIGRTGDGWGWISVFHRRGSTRAAQQANLTQKALSRAGRQREVPSKSLATLARPQCFGGEAFSKNSRQF